MSDEIQEETRLCERCNKQKPADAFRGKICRTCHGNLRQYKNRTKGIKSIRRLKSELKRLMDLRLRPSLDISELTKEDQIICIYSDMSRNINVSYKKAVYLVEKDLAKVVNPKIIYMIDTFDGFELTYNRLLVLIDSNLECHYCGEKAITVDHVVPKSKGGNNSIDNLVACCKKCNKEKADIPYEEFIKTKKITEENKL